jgi:asparaginyl-tRNA synthetase
MISDILDGKITGEVKLRGWIYRKREQKDIIFIILRDSSGIIQLACKGVKEADKATIESSIEIKGKVKEDKRAPGGFEVEVKDLKIVGLAERFPISKDLSEEFKRDVRQLWVRSRELTAVFKIRSKVFEAIHEFFHKKDFYETQSPILLSGVAESGPDLFEVKFFDKKLYLAQTWQLHAEALLPSLEKIYTVIPAFRAEKTRTIRHLAEYWTAEAEVAWYRLDDCIKLSEELISYICLKVAKECSKELKELGRDPKDLLAIKTPFPRITYTEAVEILEKDGMKIEWGKDLRTEEERQVMKHYKKPLIVTHYPKKVMAFYKPRDPKDPEVALCYDIICPEIGIEIVGGSERDLSIEELKKSLKALGEDPEKYEFYFDTRRYGAVPHSGFGLGIERVILWICKLDHIMDTIPFPRTFYRYSP